MTDPRPLTGFPRTWAFSGMVWKVVCDQCREPLRSPVALTSDGRKQLAYCTNPTRCDGMTEVRVYALGDHSGSALIQPARAMEFQEVRKWQREHPRPKEKPGVEGVIRAEGSFETELGISLGLIDCPICEESILIVPHFAGPTAQPATAECPHCKRPIRIELR